MREKPFSGLFPATPFCVALCRPSPHSPKAGLPLAEGPGGGGGTPPLRRGLMRIDLKAENCFHDYPDGRQLLPCPGALGTRACPLQLTWVDSREPPPLFRVTWSRTRAVRHGEGGGAGTRPGPSSPSCVCGSHSRVTPRTAAPRFTGFSRQECWSGVPFPSPRDLNLGIKPASLASPALAVRFFTTSTPWVRPSFCKPEGMATRNLARSLPPLNLHPRVQSEHGCEASKPSRVPRALTHREGGA